MREYNVTVTFSTTVTATNKEGARELALDAIAHGDVSPEFEIEKAAE